MDDLMDELSSERDCPGCGAPAGLPPAGPCIAHGTPQAVADIGWAARVAAHHADLLADDPARDRLAEEWLIARHGPDWYIGDATADEWTAAYAAVDATVD